MKLVNLVSMLQFWGACETAWVEEQLRLKPDSTIPELWAKMLKLPHRTGIAWGAWLAKKLSMECHNGTFSGEPKVNSGPGVEQLDVVEVERRLLDGIRDWEYFVKRRDAILGGMRA